jgi:DNA-binding NtrC family response regulator
MTAPSSNLSVRSSKVLHVDDDPSILRLVATRLKKDGIEVLSMEDPRNVKAEIIKHDIRIVILDVDMPYKNGLDVLAEIKELDAGIQVIMCTGMVSLTTITRAISLGADACVFKPLTDLNRIARYVEIAFDKIDRWWQVLDEWKELRAVNRLAGRHAEVFDGLTGLPYIAANPTTKSLL